MTKCQFLTKVGQITHTPAIIFLIVQLNIDRQINASDLLAGRDIRNQLFHIWQLSALTGVLHPWTLFLKTFQNNNNNNNNFGQSARWIWLEMFQGAQKSLLYFNRDHGCDVTVNNVWKSVFSMFWSIINNNLSAVARFLRM